MITSQSRTKRPEVIVTYGEDDTVGKKMLRDALERRAKSALAKETVPVRPTGPEMLREIASRDDTATLDTVLRRNPRSDPTSDDDLNRLVRTLRAERAQIDVKQEKRREKKQGVVNDEMQSK